LHAIEFPKRNLRKKYTLDADVESCRATTSVSGDCHQPTPTTPTPPPFTTKLENERPPRQTLAAPKPFGGERIEQKSYLQRDLFQNPHQ